MAFPNAASTCNNTAARSASVCGSSVLTTMPAAPCSAASSRVGHGRATVVVVGAAGEPVMSATGRLPLTFCLQPVQFFERAPFKLCEREREPLERSAEPSALQARLGPQRQFARYPLDYLGGAEQA